MYIEFKYLKLKNFLSYGNKVESIYFSNGITLIASENGSGKSAIIDGLFFNLFGKPYRNINKGELVNFINGKELYTEVLLSASGKDYLIKRGIKPNIFEIYIDNVLVPIPASSKDYQKLLQEELQLTETIFRQLISLSTNLSSNKTFVDMTKQEKEEFFEIITDIHIFKELSTKIKEIKKPLLKEQEDISYKIDVLNENYNNLKEFIKNQKKQYQEMIITYENQKKELNRKIKELSNKSQEITNKLKDIKEYVIENKHYIKEYEDIINDINKIENKKYSLLQLRKSLERDIRNIDNNIEKLKNNIKDRYINIKCSYCGKENQYNIGKILNNQKIDTLRRQKEDKEKELIEVDKKIEKVDIVLENINKSKSLYEKKYNDVNNSIERIKDLKREYEGINNEIESNKELLKKIDSFDKNKIKSELRVNEEKLSNIRIKVDRLDKKLKNISKDIEDWDLLLKYLDNNNLKGLILKQNLPIINKYINMFIQEFNLNYIFKINEKLAYKIYYKNLEMNFNNLSNGQKMRVFLSILFAFLKLVESKNTLKVNIFILDEILDSSLDYDGIIDVFRVLKSDIFNDKNIIIISHNPNIRDSIEFDKIINIKKENNFSKIVEEV